MTTLFNSGDEEYFKWMDQNPDGLVLNTNKGARTNNSVLHRSNCSHITKTPSFDNSAYTQRDFIKVGAETFPDILAFCKNYKINFNGKIKICSTCQPIKDSGHIANINYPDEIDNRIPELLEGAMKSVVVNQYERNTKAREKCIQHYGAICQCCSLNFGNRYGEIGVGFIHVHHIKLLSQIGEKYLVNPIKDLIPLCPNCHAMVHRTNPPLDIDELRDILSNNT